MKSNTKGALSARTENAGRGGKPSRRNRGSISSPSISYQSSNKGSKGTVTNQDCCMFLDLTGYKTQPCTIVDSTRQHNPKHCIYYHDVLRDKRRQLGAYKSELCHYVRGPNKTAANCPHGDSCQMAHNTVEEFYHPDKYKAKFCASYFDPENICEYGDHCAFAHTDAEISIELIDRFERDTDFYLFHFKTVWCPYNEDGHQREACVFAHNWQDFRRKPHQYSYNTNKCPNWNATNTLAEYQQGCQNGLLCEMSHGWKECEYHPDSYKRQQCKNSKSVCGKRHCPYYHSSEEKRQEVLEGFRVFPKSRIVNFNSVYYQPYLISASGETMSNSTKQTSFSLNSGNVIQFTKTSATGSTSPQRKTENQSESMSNQQLSTNLPDFHPVQNINSIHQQPYSQYVSSIEDVSQNSSTFHRIQNDPNSICSSEHYLQHMNNFQPLSHHHPVKYVPGSSGSGKMIRPVFGAFSDASIEQQATLSQGHQQQMKLLNKSIQRSEKILLQPNTDPSESDQMQRSRGTTLYRKNDYQSSTGQDQSQQEESKEDNSLAQQPRKFDEHDKAMQLKFLSKFPDSEIYLDKESGEGEFQRTASGYEMHVKNQMAAAKSFAQAKAPQQRPTLVEANHHGFQLKNDILDQKPQYVPRYPTIAAEYCEEDNTSSSGENHEAADEEQKKRSESLVDQLLDQ